MIYLSTKIDILLLIVRILIFILIINENLYGSINNNSNSYFGISANKLVYSPVNGLIYTELYKDFLIAIDNESLTENGHIYIVAHEFRVKPIMEKLLEKVVFHKLHVSIILDAAVWFEDGDITDEKGILNYHLWVAWYKVYKEYKANYERLGIRIGVVDLHIFNGNYSTSGIPMDHPCKDPENTDLLCYSKQSSNDACYKKKNDDEYNDPEKAQDGRCLDSDSHTFNGKCPFDGDKQKKTICKYKTALCNVNGIIIEKGNRILQTPDGTLQDSACCDKATSYPQDLAEPLNCDQETEKCTGRNNNMDCECCVKVTEKSTYCKANYKECQYSRCACQWRHERLHAKMWVFKNTNLVIGGSFNITYASFGKWIPGYPGQNNTIPEYIWMYNIENFFSITDNTFAEFWINEFYNIINWGIYYKMNKWDTDSTQQYKYIEAAEARLDLDATDIQIEIYQEEFEKTLNGKQSWLPVDNPINWVKVANILSNIYEFSTEFNKGPSMDLNFSGSLEDNLQLDKTIPGGINLANHQKKYKNCQEAVLPDTSQPLKGVYSLAGYRKKNYLTAGYSTPTWTATPQISKDFPSWNDTQEWANRHILHTCETPLLNYIVSSIINAEFQIIITQYNFSHTGTWEYEWSVIVDAIIYVLNIHAKKGNKFVFQMFIDSDKLCEKSDMWINITRLYNNIIDMNRNYPSHCITDISKKKIGDNISGILVFIDHPQIYYLHETPPTIYDYYIKEITSEYTFGINKMHVKCAIIDKIFINGSTNLSNKGLGKSNGKINIESICGFSLSDTDIKYIVDYFTKFISYTNLTSKLNPYIYERGMTSIDFIYFIGN